jgi:DNA-binding MarR family transcriptional regulator
MEMQTNTIENPAGKIRQSLLTGDNDFKVWVLILQASDVIYRLRNKELRRYGITTSQAAVLYLISVLGERATPARLARYQQRKPNTMSNLLIRMERMGLVKRAHGSERKNLVQVTITERGRSALSNAVRRDSIREVISGLGKDEIDQLVPLLEKLNAIAASKYSPRRKPLGRSPKA